MNHPDETNQVAQAAPVQVLRIVAQLDILFPVDRTWRFEEILFEAEPSFEFGLVSVSRRTSWSLFFAGGRREISDGVRAKPSDQMVLVGQQDAGELGGGVISVGHDGHGLIPGQADE